MPAQSLDSIMQAFRYEQLGLYSRALEEYRKALDAQPDNLGAANRYFRLLRDMRPESPDGLKLIWQVDPRGSTAQIAWVRLLLSGLDYSEIVDGKHCELHDGAIVVDQHISPQQHPYYLEMLKRGNRFALIHLSDALYGDDVAAYGFANLVFRTYWSRAHAADRCVVGIPLGLSNGFKVETSPTTFHRPHVWSFAGNTSQRSRAQMLRAMSGVEGGRHEASDVPLSMDDYARLLSETIFAPCPAGQENLDSFRVCEALEAGCIPIVEKRPFYDYFRHLFGDHPMLAVSDWSEAPVLIAALQKDRSALDRRRLACARWWQDYKTSLVVSTRDRILQSFSATV